MVEGLRIFRCLSISLQLQAELVLLEKAKPLSFLEQEKCCPCLILLFRFSSLYTDDRFAGKSTDVSESFISVSVEKIIWKYGHSSLHNECPVCKASASLTCTIDAQKMIKCSCWYVTAIKDWRMFYFFPPGLHWEISSAVRMKMLSNLFCLICFYHLKSKMKVPMC